MAFNLQSGEAVCYTVAGATFLVGVTYCGRIEMSNSDSERFLRNRHNVAMPEIQDETVGGRTASSACAGQAYAIDCTTC